MDWLESVASELGSVATEAASQFRVSAATSVTPGELTVYAPSSGPSLLEWLGIDYALIVRAPDGRVVATYGDPPAFNPVAAATLAAVVLGAVLLVAKVAKR